jgi:hypothetical protein
MESAVFGLNIPGADNAWRRLTQEDMLNALAAFRVYYTAEDYLQRECNVYELLATRAMRKASV